MFGAYMPDFQYELVSNCAYTNEELLARGNEMSLIMMLNKIQTARDFGELRQLPQEQMEQVDRILENAPKHVKEIIKKVLSALMVKMNVPLEEADEYIKMMGENRMGYLFENIEKMDIQEERRNTEQARKDADKAKKEADQAKKEADQAKRGAAEQTRKAVEKAMDAAKNEMRDMIRSYISTCADFGATKEMTIDKLTQKCGLNYEEAKENVNRYWVNISIE